MTDDLMRRIEVALDAPGGIDSDVELRAMLASDPEARAYADDLVRLGDRLQAMGDIGREVDWEKLAARIEARLDEPLDDLDVLGPPVFDDASMEHPLDRRAPKVSQEVPVAAARHSDTNVVDLGQRRAAKTTAFYWMGGLAAAAAVGLGIMLGTSTLEDEESLAMGPSLERTMAEEAQQPETEPAAAEYYGSGADMPAAPMAVAPQPVPDPAAAMAEGEAEAPAEEVMMMRAEPPVVAQAQAPPAVNRAGRGNGAPGGGLGDLAAPALTLTQIRSALSAADDAIRHCIATRREPARVNLRVRADGSFESVQVAPPYSGADARCIEDAIRAVQMPPSIAPYGDSYVVRPAPHASSSQANRMAPSARMRAARESAPPPPQAAPRPARRPAEHGADIADPFAN